jgi:mono/diheme cytochrome c family protein
LTRSRHTAVRIGLLAMLAASLTACTRIEDVLARVPAFAFMRSAPSFDPYEAPRGAPPNSVPFESPAGAGEAPLLATEVALNALGAGARNPVPASDATALKRGGEMYQRYCMVCHGTEGKGDGPILNKAGETGKFPFAPNLTLAPAATRADGYLYGIIRVGRGLMPAYGDKIPEYDRWTIVNYLRTLQPGTSATAPVTPAAAPPAPR